MVSFESMHGVLRTLTDQMVPMCGDLISISSGLAGIGALLYISYRVWQAIARAEPIDVFPLLRPFAIGLCILLFPKVVIGGLNGILDPLVVTTHTIMKGQTFSMQKLQDQKDELERKQRETLPAEAYYTNNEEYNQLIDKLVAGENQSTMQAMYADEKKFNDNSILTNIFRWVLELLFEAASLVIDAIRSFYLIVLGVLGPIAFAVSVFDGFQSTLIQWLSKYVSIYLWLPVSDLFGAMLARLQTLSLQKDIELMTVDPFYFAGSGDTVYLIFLVIGICGYFTIPSIASWIVSAGGATSGYNRNIVGAASVAAGAVGAATGKGWGNVKKFGKFLIK